MTRLEKLRVLHPITRLIVGGAQENTLLTAEMLDPQRWQVQVVTGPQTGAEGSLLDSARSAGVDLIIEPSLVREISPINDLRAFWRLKKMVRDGKFVIVHTHSSKAGIVGRWAAKAGGAAIIIHTVHGWGHHDHQSRLVRNFYILLEKLTLPITDKLIAVSPSNVEKGLTDGIGKPNDYVVIRSGIEFDRFGYPTIHRDETRRRWGIPLDVPLIGTVTRLSPQKAPLDFVTAAAKIHISNPHAWFLMVGDGPLYADVMALAESLDIADQFILTGLRRDIPELMAAFDIFALSSLWEGLPRVLPQAMATGLPIVTTGADGSSEIIEDGVNGLVVPAGEPNMLADAVTSLLADPDRAAQMGEVGLSRVAEYGAEQMVAQIAALYDTLLVEKSDVIVDEGRVSG